jgi:hypothetical protein
MVTGKGNNNQGYSSSATVNVGSTLQAGTISKDHSILSGESANHLTSTSPSGGSGSVSYQWQTSVDNSTWTDIPGATSRQYWPGELTVTHYYRLRYHVDNESALSNTVTVTVIPRLKPGSVSGDQTIAPGTIPAEISNEVLASGGSGEVTYQWQFKTDNSNWTDIPGATSETYQPGVLNATTYFRRQAMSGTQIVVPDAVVTIIVADMSYVSTKTYTREGGAASVMDIDYFNGLGDIYQKVSVGASPKDGKSIVTPMYYDALRRQSRVYLPYVSASVNEGTYDGTALISSQRFFYDAIYNEGTFSTDDANRAFTENVYEASPLNRVTQVYNIGSVFQGIGNGNKKPTKFDYLANGENEVILFKVTNSGTLTRTGNYVANTLYKKIMTNEDGTVIITYTDPFERMVLERVATDGTDMNLDTYYVYDDRGNLCYVLPPQLSYYKKNSNVLSDADGDMAALAYIYKYDGRNRCIEKRLPGAESVYMIYDTGGRMVMTQDGNQRIGTSKQQLWLYTNYDNLGRVVSQRLVANTGDVDVQSLRDHFSNTSDLPSSFTTVAMLVENTYGK